MKLFYALSLDDSRDIICSDYGKLHLVFSNLIQNAIKFTQEGEIEFGHEKEDSVLKCYVRDTGTGIPMEKFTGLTNDFMLGDPLSSGINEGLGLGIYLSAAMVKMLGGEFSLAFTSERGTKFLFSFPGIAVSG